MKKIHYDYAAGLNSPYWIRVIKHPKTGRILWVFKSPISLSYFAVLALSAVVTWMMFSNVILFFMDKIGAVVLVGYFYLMHRISRLYCEFEPDGKKIHIYLIDVLKYYRKFKNKQVYREDYFEDNTEIEYERTTL